MYIVIFRILPLQILTYKDRSSAERVNILVTFCLNQFEHTPYTKIRHFYPLVSRASGTKNPLALMIF